MNKEKQLVNKIATLVTELEKVRRNTVLFCSYCKKGTKISKLSISQKKYYSIEDWEYDDDYRVICPKCDKASRFFDKEDKQFQLVKRLFFHFKSRHTHE